MKPNQKVRDRYYGTHESERLTFRNMEEADVERWVPFFDDEANLNEIGMLSGRFKNMTNIERATDWIGRQIERMNTGSLGQLAAIEKTTGKFIGVGGIIFREEPGAFGEWEITYSLLPEARDKGYATELAMYFRDWTFENTQKESVISIVHVNNVASQRVTEKNGMHVEKELTFFEMPCRLNRIRKK